MTESTQPITLSEFRQSEGVEDWRAVAEGACAFFRTDRFVTSTEFVGAIGELVGGSEHVPDIDVRRDGVTVRLVTMTADHYGVSRRDAELAGRISALARDRGLSSDPSRIQSLLVVPGAPEVAAVMPFWRALLDYKPRPDSPDEDLIDPRDRGAPFWFEQMDEPRPGGGGAIHIAVWVPEEEAEARVAAALAAGGRMVRDEFAPTWWTLADAAGNEADISTTAGRG